MASPPSSSAPSASLVLHGSLISPYTRRVLAALFEMGVEDVRLEDVYPLRGDTKKPEFLQMQPFGRIPVLEDNGEYLYESRTVMRYVAERYRTDGAPNLLGTTLMDRARVNQWIDVEGHTFSPPVMTIVYEKVFKPHLHKLPTDAARWEEGRKKLASVLDIYEKHLEGRRYLVGDAFTLADLTHLPFTELLRHAGAFDLIAARPNVSAWWERISRRPAWAKVQEVHPYDFPVPPGTDSS